MQEQEITQDEIQKVDNQAQTEQPSGEEQPNIDNAHTATAEEDLGAKDSQNMGSSLGKFKTAESLLIAYNNLQAEFTRKSQKLSDMAKQLQELQENALKNEAPCFERADWQERVEKFLQANPQAKEYVAELTKEILQDNALQKSVQPLEFAYSKVLAKKVRSPQELVQSDEFLNDHIFNNEAVKTKVINNYLNSLQQNRGATVIGAHNGSAFSLAPKAKPKNLDEAKILAEAFFKI